MPALSLELCFQDAIPFVAQSLKLCSHNAFPKLKTVRFNTAVIPLPGSILSLHFFPCYMLIKYSEKSNLQLKNFVLAHSLRVQFIKTGKSWRQVLEAVGHIVFRIRKQSAMNTGCCSALFCYLCGPESQPQDGATHSGGPFKLSAMKRTSHRHAQRIILQLLPESVKLLALIIRVKLVCMIVVWFL